MSEHKNERPLSCEICEQSFKCESYLRDHVSSHTNNRHFSCQICQKSYKRKRDLTRHIEIHSEEREFLCTRCEKSFDSSRGLKHHLRQRPFSCQYASWRKAKQSNLHTSDTPFAITIKVEEVIE